VGDIIKEARPSWFCLWTVFIYLFIGFIELAVKNISSGVWGKREVSEESLLAKLIKRNSE